MENSAEVPAGQRAGRDIKGKPQKGTDKQRGELAEMHFMLKAAGLGFGVAKPWGESERYDFVLDTGKKFWRVQVKSTYVARAPKYSVNVCRSIAGKKKTPYTAEEIDILVVYIVAEDAWYVLPLAVVASRTRLYFAPSGSKRGGIYERYREAWDLMKAEPSNPDLDRSPALGR
jgi:PD-(D/E)XK endonuclease